MASSNNPVVALYLKDLRAGGAQRVFLNLCRGFLDAGLGVDLVLARGEGALLEQLPDEVRLVNLGARGALAAMPALRRYVKERHPAVLLASINYVNVTALLVTRPARPRPARSRTAPARTAPTRIFVREANILNENTFRRGSLHDRVLLALMRLLYPRAERVIVNAEDTRTSLLRYGVVAQDRIELIPNPVDTARIRRLAALPAAHPWLQDPRVTRVVLGVGSLSRQKHFDLLIRAFARAVTGDGGARSRADARLMILGEGEERTNLERLAREVGVSDRVSLPGYSDNPFAAMARADLFVLCSLWEGSANVLVEALACGAPVVATDCPGGTREVLGFDELRSPGSPGASPEEHTRRENPPYGTLIPTDDEAALADAIARMLALPSGARKEVRARARRRAEIYDLGSVTDRYREVLGLETTRKPPR